MKEHPFTLDTLGDLDDGTVRHLVNAAIDEAIEDCDARPMLDKTRKITVTLSVTPVIDNAGAMKGVDAEAAVKLTLPPRVANADYLATTIKGDHVIAHLPDARQDQLFGRTNPEEVS